MKLCCVLLLLFSTAFAAASYQTGKLVGLTDSHSNSIIQNQSNGQIIDVSQSHYRLSVLLDGMIYVADYAPRWRWSYRPTDLIVNDPITVKLDGKHLYFMSSDRKAFKADIIRRERPTMTSGPPPQP